MNVFTLIKKHPSAALTITGIGFDVLFGISMGEAFVKSNRVIEAKIEEKGEKLTKKETVKETWHFFIVPFVLFGCGSTCHITSVRTGYKKQMAVAAAAAGVETAYTTMKDQLPEVVGPKKANAVKEKTAQVLAQNNLPQDDEEIEQAIRIDRTGPKNVLFYDDWGGKWFRSNTECVIEVKNWIQTQLNAGERISYNEVYRQQGLKPSETQDYFGWSDGQLIDVTWYGGTDSFVRADGTEEPYLIMQFEPRPSIGYDDLHG